MLLTATQKLCLRIVIYLYIWFILIFHPDFSFLHCYTDGSKIDDGPVGYGYVIQDPSDPTLDVRSLGSLGVEAEVFQGEVVAIEK